MADNKAKPTKPANKTPPRSPSDPTKDRAAKRLSCDSNSSHEGAVAGEISALEEAFRKFAIHGDTRATGKEMHGKNWSKLCKDCQVIDGKNVTITDVDIVFSKIKGKSSRTISFEQFKEALQELSKKRFKEKSDEEAIQEIYKLIEGKAPIISGVTVCYCSNGWIILAVFCSILALYSPASLCNPNPSQCVSEPGGNSCTEQSENKDYAVRDYCAVVCMALSLLLLGVAVPRGDQKKSRRALL